MKRFSFKSIAPLLAIGAVTLFAYGYYTLVSYALPMSRHDHQVALHSKAARKAHVFYGAALDAYEQKKYEASRRLAQLVIQDLVADTSSVPESETKFAGEAYFLLGKSLQKLGKKEAAVKAYQQSLRFVPDNRECKYNLEMLIGVPPCGGGGGGSAGAQPMPQPTDQPQSMPQHGKTKPKI